MSTEVKRAVIARNFPFEGDEALQAYLQSCMSEGLKIRTIQMFGSIESPWVFLILDREKDRCRKIVTVERVEVSEHEEIDLTQIFSHEEASRIRCMIMLDGFTLLRVCIHKPASLRSDLDLL